jgi:uncharacterized protein YabE (DUF348 family)/3D (Asp-Asp-Asp) domain-containing protein
LAYWLEGVPVHPETRSDRQLTQVRLTYLRSLRARRHYAFLVTLAVAGVLSFVIFPAKRLVLTADGGAVVAVTRNANARDLMEAAGVPSAPGDIVRQAGHEVRLERATPVIVRADGRAVGWWTHATSLAALFEELGVSVGPFDSITLAGELVALDYGVPPAPGPPAADRAAMPAGAPVIAIRRAVPLTIVENGQVRGVESSRLTLQQVLADAGVTLREADVVSLPLSLEPVAGMRVEVLHAREVTIRVGSSSRTVRTQKQTIGEVLLEAGYQIGQDDRVEPAIDARVFDGISARLVRVAGRSLVERQELKHKTVFKPDEGLSGTNTRIVQGRDGLLLREFRIVIEDGVEREKKLVREWQEPAVTDTVIYYAASALHATGLPPETLRVQRTEHVYATWYNAASAGRDPTDPHYGVTYTGMIVTKGVVAVDPAIIPLGTRLYIPGYGFAVAADTGGGIKGHIIDLGYPDGVAVDWRTGWVDIFILAP